MKMQSRQRRVALLIESSRAYAREVINGIARYNLEQPHWMLEFAPRGLDDPLPSWMKDWKGDGILARVRDRRMANSLLKKGIPVVDLRRTVQNKRIPTVGPDDSKVVAAVIHYIRQRGFNRLGFVGLPPGTHKSMDDRAEYFRQYMKEIPCESCELLLRVVEKGDLWDKKCRQILRWIKKLDRPTAIMACNDDTGMQVLDACRRAEIRVPDEIAVVGVGNDECLCNLSLPALTSVDLNPQKIGYEAAALLERMMEGHETPLDEIRITPRGVVSRMSSDVVAADDARVSDAIVFIRKHACEGAKVEDVLKFVHTSRATLEPKFKRILGRTIHQEIQRVRLHHVRELLENTDLPIKQIARKTGYLYPEYLMSVFRQATGQTLKQYRESARTNLTPLPEP